jgi:hypothetical protein
MHSYSSTVKTTASSLAELATNVSAMGILQTLRHFLGLGILHSSLFLVYANYSMVFGICQ